MNYSLKANHNKEKIKTRCNHNFPACHNSDSLFKTRTLFITIIQVNKTLFRGKSGTNNRGIS